MEIVLNIPDKLALQMSDGESSLSRAALEALALEGYRAERFSESDIRALLGFETRMEVHAFLKEHGAYMHYSLDDLERDWQSSLRMKEKRAQSLAASGN